MPTAPRVSRLWPLSLAALMLAGAAHADALRVIAADDRGVTLRFDLTSYELRVPLRDGRSDVVARGLQMLDTPGRPQLPMASALIALPPGARASAVVVDGAQAESRTGVSVTIGAKPGYRLEAGAHEADATLDAVPAIADGVWPRDEVTVGEPFTFRRQRLVAVQVHPFRYDESAHRLDVRRFLTVRVNFTGASSRPSLGAAPPDRYFEPVLRGAVLNYEQGRSWRGEPGLGRGGPALFGARPTRLAGTSLTIGFDESQPEVRVKIDSTGVYGISFDELAAHGYPAGVPVSEVSVHRHEFLEGQAVPYGTIEMPVELDDVNANGVFDSADQLLVYVQDWASRSGATYPQRVWGDADMIYVTRVVGRAGLRLPTRDVSPGRVGLTPLASFPYSQHFEITAAPYLTFPADTMQDRYGWTGILTYYIRPDTILFEANHLDTTRPVQFVVNLMGRGPDPHVVFGSVENKLGQFTTLFDSSTVTWGGKQAITISSNPAATAFSEGRFNHLVLWGKNDALSPPDPSVNNRTFAGLDWFDFSYWRLYRALAGYLKCNSADAASAPYEIFAQNFTDSSSARAWDVTDPTAPQQLTGYHVEKLNILYWGLRLQDSTGAQPRNYVLFDRAKGVPSDHYSTVTRYGIASHTAGDYLLIVPEALLATVQPLVDLRTSQGMSVVVAPAEGLYDEFNGGRRSAYAIKRFVRFAYSQWNARFVTLVGSGAGEDPQNQYGTAGADWVPTNMILSPVPVFIPTSGDFASELIPSDPWYVWCVDPACTDPSLAPKLHDLFIGRLPVSDAAEAASVIQKVVAYDAVSPADDWRRRMTLFADDDFSGNTTFGGGGATSGYCERNYERLFRVLNETIQSVILNDAGLRLSDAEVFNEGAYLTNETISVTTPCPACEPDTCRTDLNQTITHARALVTPALFSRLNAGRLWWNYQGHANEHVLSHESFFLNDLGTNDNGLYQNDGRPFFFSAFSCHANNFARLNEGGATTPVSLRSIGENMVCAPSDRGAVASWASVGYEVVPSNGVSHINVELARALFSSPPRDPDLSDRGSRVVLGEAIALALARWEPQVRNDPLQRGVGISYNLLGDPATRLSIGTAQALVTANGDTMTDGVAFRLHTPGDTLRLEADLVSNQAIDSLWLDRTINGGLTTVVPSTDYTLSPTFPDTAAGGAGGRHYHLIYRTSLGPSTYRYVFHTIDRDGVPGQFTALFAFQTVLRSEGTPINDGDPVSPTANLSLLVVSPGPIQPLADLTLTVGGNPQVFDTASVASDGSRREWVLTWTHEPYPVAAAYDVHLAANAGATSDHQFRVDVTATQLQLQNAMAFPNPFDDDLGTAFSFVLSSGAPADVLIRVYTVTGRLIYSQTLRGLQPGYHQIPWDGRDAQGHTLANGIYPYRMVAHNGSASASMEGRLVKLRRPRRVADATTP
jgi:hypothetical protein